MSKGHFMAKDIFMTDSKKNILVINGGGGTEHDVSLVSSAYLTQCLKTDPRFEVYEITIERDGRRTDRSGKTYELRRAGELFVHETQKSINIDFFVPCIHGPPGETGEIQSIFELMGKPYLGVGPEASTLCFNKVSTKLWLDSLGIRNTPWIYLIDSSEAQLQKAHAFFQEHQDLYIKAASQGSSVGCYHCQKSTDLKEMIEKAFSFSKYVLIEKGLKARELEASFFEVDGQLQMAGPGEILCPQGFYDFEEKYNQNSKTQTNAQAEISPQLRQEMLEMGTLAYRGLKLRHLSRIDFFLTPKGKLYLNEINTFPGMTPISLFPKMIEARGLNFAQVINDLIARELKL
jgi:D-alanine-D-alanine ligase